MLYHLPTYWQMFGRVEVEADSLDEAIAKANTAGTLPEGEYVADSFAVDEDVAHGEYDDGGQTSPSTQDECMKKTLTLRLLGEDPSLRPIYRGDDGRLYTDVSPYKGYAPEICHKQHDSLNGIPELPIADDIEVIFEPFRFAWD